MNKGNSDKTAKVRIITKSKMRYEGELFHLNPEEKTICLKQVRSFGTEDRVEGNKVAGVDTIFECVVFKSKEIEDLLVLKKEVLKTKEKEVLLQEGTKNKKSMKKKAEEKEAETKANLEEVKPEENVEKKENIVVKEEEKVPDDSEPKVQDREETNESESLEKTEEKKEEDEMDLQSFHNQTEKSKLHSEKQEAKEKRESKAGEYQKDDFFDKITTSTGKWGRGTGRNYLQMETNTETFDMTKKEIQDSIKEHRKFKYRGKRRNHRGNNKKSKKQGYTRKEENDQEYLVYKRKDEVEKNKEKRRGRGRGRGGHRRHDWGDRRYRDKGYNHHKGKHGNQRSKNEFEENEEWEGHREGGKHRGGKHGKKKKKVEMQYVKKSVPVNSKDE